MSFEKYSLQVISKHPEFNGRPLKKYSVNGLSTVGVWGNEPFEVVFKNNTFSRVQVKISIDGTDILTGGPADTNVGDMWVVNGMATLTLKAWPETNKAGAQFIFTSAEKSVAVNTHGDLSSRSIIAAAVFTESYVAPNYWHNNGISIYPTKYFGGYDHSGGWGGSNSIRVRDAGDPTYGTNINSNVSNSVSNNSSMSRRDSKSLNDTIELQSLAAVGAGQTIQQSIQQTTGLINPALSEVVRLRYQWWNELQDELKYGSGQTGSGFPGEERKMMSIGSTPRFGDWSEPVFPVQQLNRF